jgi:hypothetical protein
VGATRSTIIDGVARGLFARWFGAGRMPPATHDRMAGETVLFQTEGIRVTLHRAGRVPGTVVAGGVNVGFGAFAVTDRRVVGSRGRATWVDVAFEQPSDGPAELTLDATGLHVRFDLDRVHPSCHGEMRIDFRQELSDADLARLPARHVSFPVDPQKVVRLFGSLRKLPGRIEP